MIPAFEIFGPEQTASARDQILWKRTSIGLCVRGFLLAVAGRNHFRLLRRLELHNCPVVVHVNFYVSTGTGEVWSDGDKVPGAVSRISVESSDGDGAETENAGECNPLSDIPYQDIPRQAKINQ